MFHILFCLSKQMVMSLRVFRTQVLLGYAGRNNTDANTELLTKSPAFAKGWLQSCCTNEN